MTFGALRTGFGAENRLNSEVAWGLNWPEGWAGPAHPPAHHRAQTIQDRNAGSASEMRKNWSYFISSGNTNPGQIFAIFWEKFWFFFLFWQKKRARISLTNKQKMWFANRTSQYRVSVFNKSHFLLILEGNARAFFLIFLQNVFQNWLNFFASE